MPKNTKPKGNLAEEAIAEAKRLNSATLSLGAERAKALARLEHSGRIAALVRINDRVGVITEKDLVPASLLSASHYQRSRLVIESHGGVVDVTKNNAGKTSVERAKATGGDQVRRLFAVALGLADSASLDDVLVSIRRLKEIERRDRSGASATTTALKSKSTGRLVMFECDGEIGEDVAKEIGNLFATALSAPSK